MSDENAIDKRVRIQEKGISFYVKITIKATPEKGKANQTLIQFLAKTFKIRQSAISILHGNTDRMKLLFIEGDTTILKDLLGKYR
jgi:uncharacterized protein